MMTYESEMEDKPTKLDQPSILHKKRRNSPAYKLAALPHHFEVLHVQCLLVEKYGRYDQLYGRFHHRRYLK